VFDTKSAIQPEFSEAPKGRLHAATQCYNPRLTMLTASLKKYKHKYTINHCLKWQRNVRREGVHSNLEVRSGRSIHDVAF